MKKIKGTGVALITPFYDNGSIDINSLNNLIDYNISNGINYIVLLGTTSEYPTLNESEKDQIINIVKKKCKGKISIILGVSDNNTSNLIDSISKYNKNDFDALLIVCPYYNKPSQDGIFKHYSEICNNTEHNIIIYNVPSRTGVNISPETTIKLSNYSHKIIGIKEASYDFNQLLRLIKLNTRDDFSILSGEDNYCLHHILAGADGVISVLAQAIPYEFSHIINLCLKKHNLNEIYDFYYKHIDLINYIFEEGNPTGIKALLYIKKYITSYYTRLPLIKASNKLIDKINYNLINI